MLFKPSRIVFIVEPYYKLYILLYIFKCVLMNHDFFYCNLTVICLICFGRNITVTLFAEWFTFINR